MKSFTLTIVVALQILIHPFAQANSTVHLGKYQAPLKKIVQLEQNGKLKSAFWTSLQLSQDLIRNLKLNQLTVQLHETFKEHRREVIQSKTSNSANLNLLGLIRINGHETYNVTKILTINSQELAQFERSKQKSIFKMQTLLQDYVNANHFELFYLKVALAKTVQLASRLEGQELVQARQLLQPSIRVTQGLTFTAETEFQHCVETELAAYTDSVGFSLSGLLVSGGLTSQVEHFNYTEEVCKTEVQMASLSLSEVQSARLVYGDLALEKELRQLELKYFQTLGPQPFLDWGSPYLNH